MNSTEASSLISKVSSVQGWFNSHQNFLLYDLDFIWSRVPFPPIYTTYAIMISLAVAIVSASSYATIHKPITADPADKMSPLYHPLDDAKTDGVQSERLEAREAYLMPVLGGTALVSIYFAFKYFSADNIQAIFSVYFALVSTVSATGVFSLSLQSACRIFFNTTVPHWRAALAIDHECHEAGPQPGYAMMEEEERLKREKKREQGKEVEDSDSDSEDEDEPVVPSEIAPVDQYLNIYFSLGEVLGLPIGLALVVLQYLSKHWIIGNILGGSVAVQGVRTIKLDSFKTGFIMLAGLFFYDIYFVFGTDVMVTVATKLDIPVKLEVPRPVLEGSSLARATAMLGLGDIVVPALFLSLCLRFDLWSFYKNNKGLSFHLARPYPKPYFTWGIVAYTLGLMVTIAVMHVFKAGQPALLYLCPAIAGSTLLVAYMRGELAVLYSFKDMDDNEERERLREERKAEKKKLKEEAQEEKQKDEEEEEEEEEEDEQEDKESE